MIFFFFCSCVVSGGTLLLYSCDGHSDLLFFSSTTLRIKPHTQYMCHKEHKLGTQRHGEARHWHPIFHVCLSRLWCIMCHVLWFLEVCESVHVRRKWSPVRKALSPSLCHSLSTSFCSSYLRLLDKLGAIFACLTPPCSIWRFFVSWQVLLYICCVPMGKFSLHVT